MLSKIKITLTLLVVSTVLAGFLFSARSYAVKCVPTGPADPICHCSPEGDCDDGKPAAVECSSAAGLKNNCIVKDINQIVNFLSAGVAVVVVGVIIVGGIQYSMAGDKPEAVSAAKQRIINGLIALVAFILTFAFLQWLIPGGVFS